MEVPDEENDRHKEATTSSDEMTSGANHLSLVLADITSKPRSKDNPKNSFN
jgi:hypothetical protein